MINIAGIGANVYDTLISLPTYPTEDTKMRAAFTKVSGGGPCATGLVAAAKLGASAAYLGSASDDSASEFLIKDLKKYGVSADFIAVKQGYRAFSSYIWLCEDTVSRTCVFDRGNIPPTKLSEEQKQIIRDADVLMVDGNDLDAAVEGAGVAVSAGTKVLYDAGGLYEGVERLLPLSDILIPSEEFALGHTGAENAACAAKILYDRYSPEVVVITRGKKGGIMFDGTNVTEYPAFTVEAVDSNGSGDVFH